MPDLAQIEDDIKAVPKWVWPIFGVGVVAVIVMRSRGKADADAASAAGVPVAIADPNAVGTIEEPTAQFDPSLLTSFQTSVMDILKAQSDNSAATNKSLAETLAAQLKAFQDSINARLAANAPVATPAPPPAQAPYVNPYLDSPAGLDVFYNTDGGAMVGWLWDKAAGIWRAPNTIVKAGTQVFNDLGQYAGFFLPIDYNPAQDSARFEHHGQQTETAIHRATRIANDLMKLGQADNYQNAIDYAFAVVSADVKAGRVKGGTGWDTSVYVDNPGTYQRRGKYLKKYLTA